MKTHQTTRQCKKCGATKPIEQFPYSHKAIGYRRHECGVCANRRVAESHKANREKRLARMRERYAQNPTAFWTPERRKKANDAAIRRNSELRDVVIAAYGGKCVCCGETGRMFLTLDHVNNDGGKMRREVHTTSSSSLYRWAIKNKFPAVLQVLCMNCNWGKARNGGICPHTSK